MPLTNRYLKYSPEITLDIFELVWNKLIEFGFKSKYDNELYNEFKAFKSTHNYLAIDDTYFNTIIPLRIQNKSEITVQEILRYDPFVNKEVIPEYVECISNFNHFTKGKIYNWPEPKNDDGFIRTDLTSIKKWELRFKPSTKEAFDAQNKSIEKWSVGSYVVFLKDLMHIKAGYIDIIKEVLQNNCIYLEKYLTMDIGRENSGEVKWFATKSEAEEFAKTLIEPIREIKQPLKQAVHCKTQEEWDFVTEKLGNDGENWFKHADWGNNESFCISFEGKNQSQTLDFYQKGNYQILSFQEWCDLNRYKMENEVKFEVGDYIILENAGGWSYSPCNDGCLGIIREICNNRPTIVDKYICSITGDILNSKNKDKTFKDIPIAFYQGKWIVRHATPEEINNHLISIGQIPAGEPLNTGVEPNKDGMFRYTTYAGTTHVGKTSTISGPLKMTLSIDDEELPMVSIIKANTIKQLLNND